MPGFWGLDGMEDANRPAVLVYEYVKLFVCDNRNYCFDVISSRKLSYTEAAQKFRLRTAQLQVVRACGGRLRAKALHSWKARVCDDKK